MHALILNAGLAGSSGNCQVVAEHAARWLAERRLEHELLVLRDCPIERAGQAIARASHLIFVTGTYWGGCSSLLQQLLEELTATEGGAHWLGKPAAVFVTAHQVGAQEVLWRLQGTLVALGCLLPPMSGAVIMRVSEQLRQLAPEACADVWGLADVATSLDNLLACADATGRFRAWQVDREDFRSRWLNGPG
ncbi:MAG TPA: NAD(P)H-dependent oxidoreductase [Polyangiaceae bacterium]